MIRLEQIDWPSRRRWSHSNRCTTCNSNTRPPRRAGQWRNIRWLSSLTSNSSSMSMASWMSPLGTLISITLLKLPSPNPRIPLILFWLNLTPYLCKSHWCISCWPLFFLSPTVSTSPIIYKSSGRKHLFYVSLFYKKKKKETPTFCFVLWIILRLYGSSMRWKVTIIILTIDFCNTFSWSIKALKKLSQHGLHPLCVDSLVRKNRSTQFTHTHYS